RDGLRILVDRAGSGIDAQTDHTAEKQIAQRPTLKAGWNGIGRVLITDFGASQLDVVLALVDMRGAWRRQAPRPLRTVHHALRTFDRSRIHCDVLARSLDDGRATRNSRANHGDGHKCLNFHICPLQKRATPSPENYNL